MRYTHLKYMTSSLLLLLFAALFSCEGDNVKPVTPDGPAGSGLQNIQSQAQTKVVTGAERLVNEQLDRLQGKRVAIVANQTSLVFGETHLVDTLHSSGINIVKVFAPEHGFRGDHSAGAKVSDSKDAKTGIPIVSLYGSNKKPSAAQLADVDIVLFDIQDVGARFYTYISTMSYVMEACAEQKKQFTVLDRPNPNGWYVEGPVLEKGLESFVGLHRVPIVHGMTVGEYARMVNGEGWLKDDAKCVLEVLTCEGYRHAMQWEETGLPWVAPSPNLPTEYSAYLYPVFCWFEGMPVSVGRGTDAPFEQFGAPWHRGYHYQVRKDSADGETGGFQAFGLQMEYTRFTPRSIPGVADSPKFMGEECYGALPLNRVPGDRLFKAGLAFLKNFEEETHNVDFKGKLFIPFFKNLTGSKALPEQILGNVPETEIYDSWQPAIGHFKVIRRKYLLYPDFENESENLQPAGREGPPVNAGGDGVDEDEEDE